MEDSAARASALPRYLPSSMPYPRFLRNGLQGERMSRAGGGKRPVALLLPLALACLLVLTGGCLPGPRMLRPEERYPIDRAKVEYPAGFDLERYIVNLTAPTAIAFDADQNLLVAEGGIGD